jgi:flagellar biogenesis protein FliO
VEDIQQTVAVMAVLTALGVALYVLRNKGLVRFRLKSMGDAGSRRLQAVERLPLTAQHSLHLVKVSGRTMLIAVSPGGCSVLDAAGWDGGRNNGRTAEEEPR